MAFTDVQNSSVAFIVDKAVDSTFEQRPLLDALDKNGAIKESEGGNTVSIPIIVQKHSPLTDLTSESTALNLATSEVIDQGTWTLIPSAAPIVLGMVAKARNQGPGKRASIWESRAKTVVEAMRDELNSRLCGNSASKFVGLGTLNGMSAGAGSTTLGIFEGAAYESQTGSFGGVAKNQYPDAWQHQYATGGGAFGTGGIEALSLLIAQCRIGSGENPHLGMIGQTAWSVIRRALTATYGSYALATREDTRAKFGYGDFEIDGVPFSLEPSLANTGGTTTNILSAVVLNLNDIQLYHSPDLWFTVPDAESGVLTGFVGEGTALVSDAALTATRLKGSGVLVHSDAYSV